VRRRPGGGGGQGGAGALPAGQGKVAGGPVIGSGGARCIRVRKGEVEGEAAGGWEGGAASPVRAGGGGGGGDSRLGKKNKRRWRTRDGFIGPCDYFGPDRLKARAAKPKFWPF
jgi:hypothetical protein